VLADRQPAFATAKPPRLVLWTYNGMEQLFTAMRIHMNALTSRASQPRAMTTPWLTNRAVVLVGGTAGLGTALLSGCLRLNPSRLWLVCRSQSRGEAAIVAAKREAGSSPACQVTIVLADLSSLKAVRRAVDEILASGVSVDALMYNAATFSAASMRGGQLKTEDGIEGAMAVNHLACMLMATALVPAYTPSGARVVITGSDADFQDFLEGRCES